MTSDARQNLRIELVKPHLETVAEAYRADADLVNVIAAGVQIGDDGKPTVDPAKVVADWVAQNPARAAKPAAPPAPASTYDALAAHLGKLGIALDGGPRRSNAATDKPQTFGSVIANAIRSGGRSGGGAP